MAVGAARKRAASKRQLSVSQQFVLEKMKHVFDGEGGRVSETGWLTETQRRVRLLGLDFCASG